MDSQTEQTNLNFRTHNNPNFQRGCSSLVGYIDISYAELKQAFGKPLDGDGYKVDAEWEIEFENGVYATIYNYKDGKNYCGKSGIPKTKIRDWHVGGQDQKALEMVKKVLNITESESI